MGEPDGRGGEGEGLQAGSVRAYVALARASPLDAEALTATWRSRWPNAPEPGATEAIEGGVAFGVGPARAALRLEEAPLPWTDLEGPAARAWHWPGATEDLRAHSAHLEVALEARGADALSRAHLLTLLVATALEACPSAVGAFWPHAPLVQSKGVFVEHARTMRSSGRPPLYLWVAFRAFEDEEDGSISVRTEGMRSFGHMEVAVRGSRREPEHLLQRVYNVATHHLASGGPLADGSTVGLSEDERIVVRHAADPDHPDRQVVLLEL